MLAVRSSQEHLASDVSVSAASWFLRGYLSEERQARIGEEALVARERPSLFAKELLALKVRVHVCKDSARVRIPRVSLFAVIVDEELAA